HHCNLPASPRAQGEVDNAQVIMAVAEKESPQRACSPPMVMDSIPKCPYDEASCNQIEELEDIMSLLCNVLNIKVFDLVYFLLFKYEMKEFTTKSEMLDNIVREYEEYHPVIFSEASECLRLFCGIDMIEVDPFVQSYTLVTALGITYDGMLSDVQGKAKTGLLIEMILRMLNIIGFYNWRDPFLYENPRKLMTEDFVQDGYLEYRQAPDSDPPSHEFLWNESLGVFFASITKSDPKSYPEKYAEALRDETKLSSRCYYCPDQHTF
uniref:MAGE domain-containing protein n=1 Tax=Cricetulus griseus TaxID=10029 RepID=A0A8C2LDN8_CRIGR